MQIPTKSSAQVILAILAISSAVLAQTRGSSPAVPQNVPSAVETRQIVERSVAATQRNWLGRDGYTYVEREEDRRLDSHGRIKSEDAKTTEMILVNGIRFEQLSEHNGHPPSADEQKKDLENFDKLTRETPAERSIRLGKAEENRAFLRDILDAFDFQLIGEETFEGRSAYVLHATPHPGYHERGKYGKILSNVEGKLWVDKQNFGWIKVEGQVTQPFSMGLFVASVQRGTHISLEETCVRDDVWVPKRIEVRASARLFFIKSLDIDRILTYSDYSLARDDPYSVGR